MDTKRVSDQKTMSFEFCTQLTMYVSNRSTAPRPFRLHTVSEHMPLSLKATDLATRAWTHLSRNKLRRSVIKATSDQPSRPPWKHLQRILLSTQLASFGADSFVCVPEVYEYLFQRLSISDSWMVVCKTLFVIHYILREGNQRLAELLLSDSATCFTSAERLIGPDFVYAQFVRKYAIYLREKVIAYQAMRVVFEHPGTRKAVSSGAPVRVVTPRECASGPRILGSASGELRRAPPQQATNYSTQPAESAQMAAVASIPGASIESLALVDAIRVLPILLDQLDALVAVRLADGSRLNDLTCAVSELLLEELGGLIPEVNRGMNRVLESFHALGTHHAIFCLHIYDRYCSCVRSTEDFLSMQFGTHVFLPRGRTPLLDHVPLDLSASLREHILRKGIERTSGISSDNERAKEEELIRKAIEESIRATMR
jgi:hypothetical protein